MVRRWSWDTPGSTAKQDLERQVDALLAAGIDPKRIYRDKKSGSTVDRPGLAAVLRYGVAVVTAENRADMAYQR
jgi:predicted site-specific integrase-resolvase